MGELFEDYNYPKEKKEGKEVSCKVIDKQKKSL